MKAKIQLTPTRKLIIIGLITATAGAVLQIVSEVHYPKVSPVFFILLVPAVLVIFGKWRWTLIIIVLAGLFLTMGLFLSGAYVRLFNMSNFGGSVGLWIQMIGVLVATIASIFAIIQNYLIPTA
jgi:hypothetical protein